MTCDKCKKEVVNYQIFNLLFFPVEAVYNFRSKNSKQNDYNISKRQRKDYYCSNQTYGSFYNNNTNVGNSHKTINIMDCFEYEISDVKFTGENEVFCNKCNKKSSSVSRYKIFSSPHILIIILDRGKGNKFECDVKFEETLNIQKYVESNLCPLKYNLIGVISHFGESSMSGHFIAECKHFDGKWYTFNDSIVSGPYNSAKGNGTPYILFYQNSEF
jgi:ubiquitin C-terminal hydrolase